MKEREEQKHTEQKSTLQPQHVVNHLKRDDNHVVRKIKQPRVENCTAFLLLQVLYCNSYSSGCQGPLKIKIALKI